MTAATATLAVPPPVKLTPRRAVRVRRAVVAGYVHGLSARHRDQRHTVEGRQTRG